MTGPGPAPVLVAGAGPVGLMLAVELRLAGVAVTVVERRAARGHESRGLGFTARAAEVLDQRGLLDRLGEVETSTQGHFGGLPLDFGVLTGGSFGVRGVPQHRVERMLEERAVELGAEVRRGAAVDALTETADGVTVTLDGPDGRETRHGAYLVGCDGGRSTVRRLAGIAFPGTGATREMYLADVVGRSIRPRFVGERLPGGMVMSAPLGDDVDRIIVCPRRAPHRERAGAPAFDEVADAWERVTGESLHGARTEWVSVFTDATGQAEHYRRGRVLLAGDAAHVHLPAGGQGLSLGVQDAVNLGWKLAATFHGTAPEGLLDSYHAERHPVGARVLRNTRAQGLLYLGGEEVEPLRAVLSEIVAVPDAARLLAGMVSGLDVHYDVGEGDDPLLGRRMPDVAVGTTTAYRALHAARGVLLDPHGHHADRTRPWRDRVDVVTGEPGPGWPRTATAVLLRPDGYVAWVAPADPADPPDPAGPADPVVALTRWFGAPGAGPATTARPAASAGATR